MALDAMSAAKIYAEVAKTAAAATSPDAAPELAKPDFAGMVKAAVSDTAGVLKAGEAAAAQVATGEAGLVDVVTAVSAAEVSLEAAIAVRNKVIEAYQEIMRMPI